MHHPLSVTSYQPYPDTHHQQSAHTVVQEPFLDEEVATSNKGLRS